MRLRLPRVSDAYRVAWHGTRHLPTSVGYGLAHTVADVLWAWHCLRRTTTGVGQLERNLSRLLPSGTPLRALRRSTRAGMRSYMRYFYEAFALPGITPDQILARVRTDIDPPAARGRARRQRRHGPATHGQLGPHRSLGLP